MSAFTVIDRGRTEDGAHSIAIGGAKFEFLDVSEGIAKQIEGAVRIAYAQGRRDKGAEIATILKGLLSA